MVLVLVYDPDLYFMFFFFFVVYFALSFLHQSCSALPASVAQLDARPTSDQEVCRVGNILSWRFDHKISSTAILSLPLIQEGQLSVSGERMCTILVNRLED